MAILHAARWCELSRALAAAHCSRIYDAPGHPYPSSCPRDNRAGERTGGKNTANIGNATRAMHLCARLAAPASPVPLMDETRLRQPLCERDHFATSAHKGALRSATCRNPRELQRFSVGPWRSRVHASTRARPHASLRLRRTACKPAARTLAPQDRSRAAPRTYVRAHALRLRAGIA